MLVATLTNIKLCLAGRAGTKYVFYICTCFKCCLLSVCLNHVDILLNTKHVYRVAQCIMHKDRQVYLELLHFQGIKNHSREHLY